MASRFYLNLKAPGPRMSIGMRLVLQIELDKKAIANDGRWLPISSALYRHVPTRKSYSDEVVSVGQVREIAGAPAGRPRVAGHPVILDSESSVLNVPGCEQNHQEKSGTLPCRWLNNGYHVL